MTVKVRPYVADDERDWLRLRVLAFLDTPYYDNVLQAKERYLNPAIELVCVEAGQLVGLIDVELDSDSRPVCSLKEGTGGMIWHIAVHPDYRRRSIASLLLAEVEKAAHGHRLDYIEAWTREDPVANQWYKRHLFRQHTSYLHVYMDAKEAKRSTHSHCHGVTPVGVFAHYSGDRKEDVRNAFKRVHECRCYVKQLKGESLDANA
ncbi:GNAT family N-acetyltransferase [Shouchella clausii]|uniref:GNAT family N-acetyltransferase n=1 Tax=Shouchella clausii TaxID=79880 RepID=UPI0015CD7652|nr:GNAT family N-acetyltransferase [Shouchella clausii]